MSIVGVSGKTSYIGASILNLRGQLDDLQTQLSSGKVSTTYAGQGPDRGVCARPARADRQHQRLCGQRDQRPDAHQRREPVAAGTGRTSAARSRARPRLRPSCSTTTARPPARSRRRPRSPMPSRMLNTQSGDRYLFSGRATDTARDGAGQRHALRHRDPGRSEATDQRAPAGRSGRRQHGASRRHVAAADDNRDQPRRRRFVVRLQARLGEFDADRRDRHAADRRAAGSDGRSRRRQSEQRREGQVQFQSSRRHHRVDRADGADDDEPRRPQRAPSRSASIPPRPR